MNILMAAYTDFVTLKNKGEHDGKEKI